MDLGSNYTDLQDVPSRIVSSVPGGWICIALRGQYNKRIRLDTDVEKNKFTNCLLLLDLRTKAKASCLVKQVKKRQERRQIHNFRIIFITIHETT